MTDDGQLTPRHSHRQADAPARLLLVDDEPLLVNSLSIFLALEGYQMDIAADGSQALEMLAATRYRMVLADVTLCRLNKLDKLELLWTIHHHYPDVIVLRISGYETIDLASQAVKMGAFEYLMKPIVVLHSPAGHDRRSSPIVPRRFTSEDSGRLLLLHRILFDSRRRGEGTLGCRDTPPEMRTTLPPSHAVRP